MPSGAEIAVLIAEDDASVRAALASLLREEGMTVVGAVSDADAAIREAVSSRPDVAIVDVQMPGGGGARAAREICRRAPETRVIALSGLDDRSSVLEMLEAGAVGYLVKGGPVQGVIDAIERAVGGQSSLSAEVTTPVVDELVEQLGARRRGEERMERRRRRIERTIADDASMQVVLQPIRDLASGEIDGVEALARFRGRPRRGPDRWFAEASDVGLRVALELAAARKALACMDEIPAGAYLSVNVSPATVRSRGFLRLVSSVPAQRVVLELTEQARVDDYDKLRTKLDALRALGARLAIDDAGAGFASLRHILRLDPDYIKLDQTLIAGIERDRSEQALAVGLISFAEAIGAVIVAEGVERKAQLTSLQRLGVRFGQGYLLGRPTESAVEDSVGPSSTSRTLRASSSGR